MKKRNAILAVVIGKKQLSDTCFSYRLGIPVYNYMNGDMDEVYDSKDGTITYIGDIENIRKDISLNTRIKIWYSQKEIFNLRDPIGRTKTTTLFSGISLKQKMSKPDMIKNIKYSGEPIENNMIDFDIHSFDNIFETKCWVPFVTLNRYRGKEVIEETLLFIPRNKVCDIYTYSNLKKDVLYSNHNGYLVSICRGQGNKIISFTKKTVDNILREGYFWGENILKVRKGIYRILRMDKNSIEMEMYTDPGYVNHNLVGNATRQTRLSRVSGIYKINKTSDGCIIKSNLASFKPTLLSSDVLADIYDMCKNDRMISRRRMAECTGFSTDTIYRFQRRLSLI